VFQGGERVGTIREYSDSLMTWLLRGLRPERYKERVDIDQTLHAGPSVAEILRGREENLTAQDGAERGSNDKQDL